MPAKTAAYSAVVVLAALLGCQAVAPRHEGRSESSRGSPFLSERARLHEPSPATGPLVRPVHYLDDEAPEAVPIPQANGVDGETLTLGLLEEMALTNNPAVARSAARVEALRGRWLQVGLPPNPVVGYLGEEMGSEGTAGQQGGFVGQRFVRGGKLALNRAVASHEIAKAEQDWAGVRQRVVTDVRLGFYDVLIARRRVDVAREVVRLSQEAVRTSESLLRAAEISRVAVLQAEVEAEQARITLQLAENESQAAWRRLAAVLGTPNMPLCPLADTLEDTPDALHWKQALARILGESPEIGTALAEVERARCALSRACAASRPDVELVLDVQRDATTDDTTSSLEVGLPLPLFDRNQGGILEARARISEAEQNVHRLELELEQRLADTYRRYADARHQIETYSQTILPKAKQTLELVDRGYRQGELDYLTLLTAQRTYSQTNLAYVEALRGLWSAVVEIDGLLLKGSLQDRLWDASDP